jgi:hypothetical protein
MVSQSGSTNTALHHSSSFQQRYPTNAHWDSLSKLQANLIDPQVFTQRWEVKYRDIAHICSCSKRTVERWFSETDYHPPSLYHRFCLGLTDKVWSDLSIRRGGNW